mmetsp:Transcript_91677/g.163172  ORF Transcript_91677/g.163172 Transcript_91677/m.163172 type:complete len:367 (+) Transcript_91677:69-1169(+)
MRVFGCCASFCFLVVLLLALLFGWLSAQENGVGAFFKLAIGARGIGKPPTEAVPDDLMPSARPEGEIFFNLPGGGKMPANGLGMCCRPSAYDAISVHRTVLWYLLQGGRHIDTADLYLNHEAVGLGIRDAVARGIPRSEIFLVTKIWPTRYGYDSSIYKGKLMLQELGVDYIDLVLLHAPMKWDLDFILRKVFGGDKGLNEMRQLRMDTWKGLSTLRDQGRIRNLGVSNFDIKQMQEVQSLGLAPIAAHQMQYHPWVPDWLKETVSYCHQHQIVITAYFSLGGMDNKQKAFEIEALNKIASSHGKRPAQVLLRWSLQKNVSIIPGTGNPKHMRENLATYGFSLSDDEMQRLDSMSSLPLADDFFYL